MSQNSLGGVEEIQLHKNEKQATQRAATQKKYRIISIVLVVIIIISCILLVRSLWTGWISFSGNRYYYMKGNKVVGLTSIDNRKYFFDDAGVMQTGWQSLDGTNYYFDLDGEMQTGWIELSGERYYLNESGAMQVGWQTIDGNKYRFDSDGVMQTGWQNLGGTNYHFGSDGVMQTGWIELSGERYHFNDSGAMQIGWIAIDGNRYYFDENGAMQTGLQDLNGNNYYFNSDGVMQAGFCKIDGKMYYFGTNGVLHTGWLKTNGQTYYCSHRDNGAIATGKWTIGGKYYYFENSGKMATGLAEIAPDYMYHFDKDGSFRFCDITWNDISTSGSDEKAVFSNRNGGQTWGNYRVLDKTIENVLSIKGEINITKVNYGNCDGQWQLHVRIQNGKWKRIGFFEVKNGKGRFEFALDGPVSFDAYVCTCYDATKWSGKCRQDLSSVTYRTYDFGTGIQSE